MSYRIHLSRFRYFIKANDATIIKIAPKLESMNEEFTVNYDYDEFIGYSQEFEKSPRYLDNLCMKPLTSGPRETTTAIVDGCMCMPDRGGLKRVCVLPKDHTGSCSKDYSSIFKKNNTTTKKLISKINLAIFSTPGESKEYVYKNRASRLFGIVLAGYEEEKIRVTTEKKACAIPLKEVSTPVLLAQAYVDWMTYIVNIRGIDEYLDTTYAHYSAIRSLLSEHKEYMKMQFSNRTLFTDDGYAMCVVTRHELSVSDVADPLRNNRANPHNTDLQLGHNFPRTEQFVTIRGGNLLPMTRRGNLIIGERVFTEDVWMEELRGIVSNF